MPYTIHKVGPALGAGTLLPPFIDAPKVLGSAASLEVEIRAGGDSPVQWCKMSGE